MEPNKTPEENRAHNTVTITKTANYIGDYDVVVCGAGPAGWTAATAAARAGAKTAIIDRYGFFGGTASGGLVIPISGFFKHGKRLVGGIPWEFVEALERVNGAIVEYPRGHVSADTEYYKLIAQRFVLDAGVDIYMNSYIIGADTDAENRIETVYFQNKNGTEAIGGKYFIDATGDGDLCTLADIPTVTSDTPQPLSFCFELIGVDTSTPLLCNSIHHDGKHGASVNTVIREYLNEKYAKNQAPEFGGPWFNTLVAGDRVAVNVTRNPASVLDNRAYSLAECRMREEMYKIVELLREKFPEFKNAVISSTAVNAGVRESRRLVGAYTLTGEDTLSTKYFYDSVARTAHPIDIHVGGGSKQTLISLDRAGYIPYRTMYTEKCDNLLVAGRLISTDTTALATARVQATCMATGEAAGLASAYCNEAGAGVAHVDIERLRRTLIDGGSQITEEKD